MSWTVKQALKLVLAILFISIGIPRASATTEFIVSVNKAGEDYNTIQAAENALDNAGDLTDGTVKCGGWDNQAGSDIADATSVTWPGGSGTLITMTASQYLIDVTSGTLEDNDNVDDGGGNEFDVNGAPDDCIIVIEGYDDQGDLNESSKLTIDGFTTSTTNYVEIRAAPGEEHGGIKNTGFEIYYDTGGDDFTYFIQVNNSNVKWTGFIIRVDYSSNSRAFDSMRVNASNCTLNRMMFAPDEMATDFDSESVAIVVGSVSGFKMYNSFIQDYECWSNGTDPLKCRGIDLSSSMTGTNQLYNNTIVNNRMGIWYDDADLDLINNIFSNYQDDIYVGSGQVLNANSRKNIFATGHEPDHITGGVTVESGTTTSTSAGKLVDSAQNFTSTVEVGHVIKNTTDSTYSWVTAVDSDTQLSINSDIFTSSEGYTIYDNYVASPSFVNAAADDFHLDNSDTTAKGKGYDLGDGEWDIDVDRWDRAANCNTYDIGFDQEDEVSECSASAGAANYRGIGIGVVRGVM